MAHRSHYATTYKDELGYGFTVQLDQPDGLIICIKEIDPEGDEDNITFTPDELRKLLPALQAALTVADENRSKDDAECAQWIAEHEKSAKDKQDGPPRDSKGCPEGHEKHI